MKVYPQSVHDQLTHEDIWFGLDFEEGAGPAYDKAMDYIKKHQEWRGGERLEYFGNEMDIQFMWDMTGEEFRVLMSPVDENVSEEMRDYLGAVFFGNFKLEFIRTDTEPYCNCYQYGADDGNSYGPYAYLEDGTPYEDREGEIAERIRIPKRRTFEVFAKNIEEQVIKLLNKYPIYIEDALVETNPTKWYPDGQCNVTRDITRVA